MAVGFFALFDDIAILMDDVAVMSKVATKKTAGILGDDLAVSADKASGFTASRELPVLWAITKGSLLNKLIILPMAFLLSAFLPWTIIPILMLGGIYLAYEGAEKIYEYFTPHLHPKEHTSLETLSKEEILEVENKKIKSAILTDFILSVEIVIIALSTVTEQTLTVQIIVVSFIALIATLGVYGIVALLVRMDDAGYSLMEKGKEKGSESLQKFGKFLVLALPKIIKSLTVIGTIAMLLVAGGIYVHNIPDLHHLLHGIPSILGELMIGALVGVIALIVVQIFVNLKLLLASNP
jgi:predicted DNA repair protein MutK